MLRFGSWTKANRSNPSGNCVQAKPSMATGNLLILVRDSKQSGQGPVISFLPEQWQELQHIVCTEGSEFLRRLNVHSFFTLCSMGFTILPHEGNYIWKLAGQTATLSFTFAEMEAFVDGVLNQEFAYVPATTS